MTVKRYRQDSEVEEVAIANCLMLLSRVGHDSTTTTTAAVSSPSDSVFECKTCGRKFASFQALGGHRTSHKKPKLAAGDSSLLVPRSPPAKPKTHECSICGAEFTIGQALGGHMRRHRATRGSAAGGSTGSKEVSEVIQLPALKGLNSNRVLCLDLNLTPYENDLKELGELNPISP